MTKTGKNSFGRFDARKDDASVLRLGIAAPSKRSGRPSAIIENEDQLPKCVILGSESVRLNENVALGVVTILQQHYENIGVGPKGYLTSVTWFSGP
jgi:hypothetical protein